MGTVARSTQSLTGTASGSRFVVKSVAQSTHRGAGACVGMGFDRAVSTIIVG